MLQEARKVVNKAIETTDDWERNPLSKFSVSSDGVWDIFIFTFDATDGHFPISLLLS